jgi:hypothetical protein
MRPSFTPAAGKPEGRRGLTVSRVRRVAEEPRSEFGGTLWGEGGVGDASDRQGSLF